MVLDKFVDNETPATEKVISGSLPSNTNEVTQAEFLEYCSTVLATVESFHYGQMNRYGWRPGDVVEENGLGGILVPDELPPKPKDKKDDAARPKRKGKKRKPEPPEGTPAAT